MTAPRIVPPATIGMLGGGQLGRYALVAARLMGYRTMVLEPDPNAPAGRVADVHLVAEYDDPDALRRLGDECEVVTTEFENPPAAALDALSRRTLVAPSPAAVAVAQNRIAEKTFLADAGLPVGPWAVVDHADADPAVEYPAIIKTARLGYDGKGQRLVDDPSAMRAAWRLLGGVPCVVEQALDLETEVSAVVARRADGGFAAYPIAENRHVDGILDLSVVPARVPARLADRAVGLAMTIADALDYVGVLAVEFFVVGGELFVNEIAPRPHNSGHWTIDVAQTSQFEQQIRAVCGLELGDTGTTRPAAAMVNLLGDLWEPDTPEWGNAVTATSALHLYGKSAARPGRKMGHLTAWGSTVAEAEVRALDARRALSSG
ncbi:5-(carboxyamino)imidazole ribonucleotide synthase [Ilumatobacter fluminis]|uniref:N5-carboxyaminoimidazole ribonucleotide synthase n=1 Tax=Ilumatobacter fluminis TaxID=467091 RepID=A0A4R7I1A0_9ACTN|nr:5-(carboxyamino)imidazole ribonucleotide synthase [Ilumatobacter fluminis]TDT16874.1 5-(carboxyamino)imidazole ribonucleotide synthase [Ilumatobacter fluminis]